MIFELGRGTPERKAVKKKTQKMRENKKLDISDRNDYWRSAWTVPDKSDTDDYNRPVIPVKSTTASVIGPSVSISCLVGLLSQSQHNQTTPSRRGLWPLPNARSGVNNLTMMCSAEPHMWRAPYKYKVSKVTGCCRSPAVTAALLGKGGLMGYWARGSRDRAS